MFSACVLNTVCVFAEQVTAPDFIVDSVSSSGDLCNVTVTCRAGDLSLTSTCDISTCTQEEQTAPSSLAIFIKDDVIICNHSNPVSWRNVTMAINQLCSGKKEMDAPSSTCTLICPHTTLIHCITFMSTITYCVLHKREYGHGTSATSHM